MNKLISLVLIHASVPILAQVTPHDQASYDAWKVSTYNVAPQPPIQMLTANQMQRATPPIMQRGGGTATCDCWIDPDGTYTTIDNSSEWDASGFHNADDGSYGPIILPFSFFLYGQLWNTAYININGNVSFGTQYGTFSSTGFPFNGFTIVAPFWADVDLRGPGAGNNIVQFKVTPTALFVNWTNVGYYSQMTDKVNTFQLIITDGTDPVIPNGANVSFCYQDMQWTTGSASGGTNGFGGTAASVGANEGNGVDYIQFGRFDQPGVAYDGPFGMNDGVDFLDDQYFTFSTDIATANVPPVITGQSVCDSLILCVGETATIDVVFLSPEPGQTTTCTASSATLSNFTIVTNTPGLTAQIVVETTPTVADVGYHIISIEGTDDGVPVMTSTLNIVVEVQQGATMTPGSLDVCSNGPPVNMLTLLGGSPPAGGDWTDPNGAMHSGQFIPGTDVDGIYLYALGQGSSCASVGEVTMTTTAAPNAGTDAMAAYCSDQGPDDLFLSLGNSPQVGGTWTDPNGAGHSGIVQPGSDPEGDYLYVVPAGAPCTNDTAIVAVSIPQAVDPGLDNAITLCTDAVPLDMTGALSGTPDLSGDWVGPGGIPSSGTFLANMDVPGTYTYTVTAILPCPTLSSNLTIAVDPLPDAGTDGTLSLCTDGPTVDLFTRLGGSPDVGGIWHDQALTPRLALLDPAVDTNGTYTYVAYGIGACDHLTDSSLVEVQVNPLPIVAFMADPDSGCHPLEVTLTNLTDPIFLGNDCVWDLGDGTVTNDCAFVDHLYEDPGWFTVTLTVTTPFGCVDHLTVPGAVLVDPAPQATFSFAPDPGTEGNSNIFFAGDDPEAVQFNWDFAGLSTDSGRYVYHEFPDVFGGEYEVCLAVSDRYGCVDTLCKVVPIVVPNIFAPTAFTPDGDGLNDHFFPIIRDMVIEDHELSIYDRWGQLVYVTTDINEGWDGTHLGGGEILPVGVYVWRLVERPMFTAEKQEYFGHVQLLK
ncbi:MAG: gliding motility-associated C-terminal domain-containing protein [Flavobacteriales bacterium]|nr:gliding motility-associated C-terminal domain-containing protein [Flavobacteriales bacterium]